MSNNKNNQKLTQSDIICHKNGEQFLEWTLWMNNLVLIMSDTYLKIKNSNDKEEQK